MLTSDQPGERACSVRGSSDYPEPLVAASANRADIRVSDEQRAAFRRDGFLHIDGLSTPDEIASLRVLYDRLFSERRGWERGDLFDMVGHDDLDRGLAIPQLLSPSRYEPRLRETQLYANAFSIARQLLGQDVQNHLEHAIVKPPLTGVATPWHQDDAFNRRGCGFDEAISIWMPLQDVDVGNGCMLYIRGSNHGPLYTHRSPGNDPRIQGLETVRTPDLTHCVAVPVRAGGAVLHHSRTLHAAGANTSGEVRRAYVLGFAVQSRGHRRFARDYAWNREKKTAREQRQMQSLSPFRRLWRKLERRVRGFY